jgi:hypothetical protein
MESISLFQILDIVIDISHFALVLFILFGWLYPSIRYAHLIVATITGISWLLYTQVNGIGNCILTDLHYQILGKLGKTNLPDTYAQYTFTRLTGLKIQNDVAMIITRSLWLLSFITSAVLCFRQYRYNKTIGVRK